ncbi:MAG: hypothetical protein FD138_4110 [Planctomycetota bacterium]|nr:MAG: hypothetical protein FD138_4110 [Planctomycetota bacterium]
MSYEFSVCTQDANWRDLPGVYIFCGINHQQRWIAHYVGQTDSFAERLPNHERWLEARQLGATHVHARVVSPMATRDQVERELIRGYQPRLNSQLR